MVHHAAGAAFAQKRCKFLAQLFRTFEKTIGIQIAVERAVQGTGNMTRDWIEGFDLAAIARCAARVDQGLLRIA